MNPHCGPAWDFNPTYNSGYEDGRKAAKERIVDLERMLAAEKERAEYALRNLAITEKARQEEMAKRDELTAQLSAALEAAAKIGAPNGR